MADRITPTPWAISSDDGGLPGRFIIEGGTDRICKTFCDEVEYISKNNAAAIVSAVNGTYGFNIDPACVPDMRDLLGLFVAEIQKPNGKGIGHLVSLATELLEKAKL